MITNVEFDEEGVVVLCEIEAVMSKRTTSINWRDLEDNDRWVLGWK